MIFLDNKSKNVKIKTNNIRVRKMSNLCSESTFKKEGQCAKAMTERSLSGIHIEGYDSGYTVFCLTEHNKK